MNKGAYVCWPLQCSSPERTVRLTIQIFISWGFFCHSHMAIREKFVLLNYINEYLNNQEKNTKARQKNTYERADFLPFLYMKKQLILEVLPSKSKTA